MQLWVYVDCEELVSIFKNLLAYLLEVDFNLVSPCRGKALKAVHIKFEFA